MSARRSVEKKGGNARPKIPESAKPGPESAVKKTEELLNSRYKSDQLEGLRRIANDINALGKFAKTSEQKDVRAMCVARLVILKAAGSRDAINMLGDIAENAEYGDARTCAGKHRQC